MNDKYIYIGYICDTHGIKGELKIKSKFDRKDLVFIPGFKLYLGMKKEEFEIRTYRYHKIYDMVTLNKFDNINQVLNLVTSDVFIKKNDLNLAKDEYLIQDLIGLSIVDNDEIIGKVKDIVYNNNNILLVIDGSKQFYIPLHSDYIIKVEIANKQIITKNAKELIL